jgi:hypothetical protein
MDFNTRSQAYTANKKELVRKVTSSSVSLLEWCEVTSQREARIYSSRDTRSSTVIQNGQQRGAGARARRIGLIAGYDESLPTETTEEGQ